MSNGTVRSIAMIKFSLPYVMVKMFCQYSSFFVERYEFDSINDKGKVRAVGPKEQEVYPLVSLHIIIEHRSEEMK